MTLALKIPPPVYGLSISLAMWLAARAVSHGQLWTVSSSIKIGILALALSGVAIALAGVIAFHRARTTINPHHPENTDCVVSTGIYRYTRNPMYLGMFLVIISWGLYLANIYSLALCPLFIPVLNYAQIKPEEVILTQRFGDAYRHYQQQVRRWL